MDMQIDQRGKVIVISLAEERLDAHNSTDLKTRLLSLFEDGKSDMVINLEEVRFVDSSGLGALVSGFKNASARNGSLKLAGLQPQVQSMFELTRLHRVFEIFPDSEDAIASFQP